MPYSTHTRNKIIAALEKAAALTILDKRAVEEVIMLSIHALEAIDEEDEHGSRR